MIRLLPLLLLLPALAPAADPPPVTPAVARTAAKVRESNCELHVGTGLGTPAEVIPLLAHRPESLSSDDPARLVRTLAELAGKAKDAGSE